LTNPQTYAGRPPRVASRARAIGTGVVVFVVAFLYRLPDATALINDHFMHVVFGRQLLWGRLPVRDAVSLGMPLQTGLSAAAEWLVGYRLLSEGLVISTAFAAAAVLTFVIIRRATGSLVMAVAGALLEVAIAPRTYSYPKLVVYAAGILLLWRYVDRPSTRRAVALGLATSLAFYLRHDHGLYLGLIAVAVMAMQHGRSLRTSVQHIAVLAATCVLCVAPFFAYVEAYGSVRDYVTDLRQFSDREHSANPFVWPSWPLSSPTSIARWTSREERSAQIGIRWNPAASDATRRQVATRYHLQVAETGPVESGRFTLYDVSTANGSALVKDPAIEDTAGIDRVTGDVYVPGWYVGPIRLLQGLDTAPASAALLFFVFLLLPAAAVIALVRNRGPSGRLDWSERVKIAAVVLVAVVTFVGFVREALDARIGDAVVAPVVLGAWLAARWLAGARPSLRSRGARAVMLLVLLIPVTRSIVVAGGVEPRFERADPVAVTWHRLVTSPPFDAWPAQASARYRIVRYVRECTAPNEPLLALSGAEFYYFADRPFAGRIGLYMEGYFSSDVNQRENAAALERDHPAVAISEPGRERTELATHPSALAFLARHYHSLGELTATDGSVFRVYGRNDRQATSTQADVGWPCYR
jgi:hypothetical protein